MYIPVKYAANEWEKQESIIKEYPLATIITSVDGELIANHIPFNLIERDNKKVLQAHITRSNHQRSSLVDNDNVLVIFKSDDSYIPPGYYPSKKETHKVVPTWDFASVHCYGKSTIIDSSEFLRSQHDSLSNQQENGRKEPWSVDQTPESYYKLLSKAIIGLEIEITRIEAKFKFEQKMKEPDVKGVINGLKEDNKPRISKFVKDCNSL